MTIIIYNLKIIVKDLRVKVAVSSGNCEKLEVSRIIYRYLNDKIENLFEPTCVMSNIDGEQKEIEKAEFINKWTEEYEKILKEERPN